MPPKVKVVKTLPLLSGKPIAGYSKDPAIPAVLGQHTADGTAIEGFTGNGSAVYGWSQDGQGVFGESQDGEGVRGISRGPGPGVYASSNKGEAVHAESHSSTTATIAAYNLSQRGTGAGVHAVSQVYEAVHAETHSPQTAAIAAYNLNPNGTGAALFAKKEGEIGHAGFFDGNVYVVGELAVEVDIKLVNAGDCAEEFDISQPQAAEPGTVMVLGPDAMLRPSEQAYDKRVAGVISGAGTYRPGIILDRRDSLNRKPIALVGKVFCNVDADYASIEIGDLLTTSDTRGHAMKAADSGRAFGSVIGKALAALPDGRGLIPILVTLQ